MTIISGLIIGATYEIPEKQSPFPETTPKPTRVIVKEIKDKWVKYNQRQMGQILLHPRHKRTTTKLRQNQKLPKHLQTNKTTKRITKINQTTPTATTIKRNETILKR